MAKTRAEIQKSYRDRKKAGRCVIRPRVEVDKGELAEELSDRGLLGDWDSESARAISLAVQSELRRLLGSRSRSGNGIVEWTPDTVKQNSQTEPESK